MAKNKKINKKNKLLAIIAAFAAIVVLVIVVVFVIFGKDDTVTGPDGEPINEKFTFLVEGDKTEILNDDIFGGQVDIKNMYTENFEKGNYSIDDPYVIINPYLISPQTALIMFETKKEESVTLTVKGKHDDDLVVEFEASKEHYIPVYGLYGDYENTVILETESGSKKTLKINITEKCDTGSVEIIKNDIKNSNGEFYFATSSLGVGAMAYDNYGEVRWWVNIGYSKGITMLSNGHILLSSANEGPDFTSTSGVVEIDMLGFVHNEYEIEGGYHHDGLELSNGNLIILTTNLDGESVADHIVEIDRNTGKIVKEWNLKDIVTKIDPDLMGDEEITWGWINSIYYDKNTDSLILSVRNQNSVVAIGYSDSKLKWILGESKYWTKAFDEYLIKGKGSNFIYPKGQHSIKILDDGRLSIFDNGYDAYKEEAQTCKTLKNNASYAVIYELDLEKREARVDWKFGGQEYFSYALSSFTYTSDNHKVFNSGWHFTDEVDYSDPECTQFSNDKYDAYFVEFDENNNIILELNVKESKFEVVKAPIYNLERESVNSKEVKTVKNYKVDAGFYLSTYEPDKYESLTEEEALKFASNDDCFITFQMYNNRFKLIGNVPDNMDMKVTFISTKGTAYRYTMKETNGELKDFIILSLLPKGKYYVYVNMGSHVYDTTEYIEIK